MFSTAKSIEIILKRNGDVFISESCVFYRLDFYSINKQKTVASIVM